MLVAIQSALRLTDADMAVSRAVLWRYGNVSSASVFYELRMVDASRKQHGKGERRVGESDALPTGVRYCEVVERVWLLAFRQRVQGQ